MQVTMSTMRLKKNNQQVTGSNFGKSFKVKPVLNWKVWSQNILVSGGNVIDAFAKSVDNPHF